MRILLTGFEPFGNHKENSSWLVATKVADHHFSGVDIALRRMPVSFFRVPLALKNAVDESKPDVILMIGQSTSDYIRLERVAINLMDSKKADNDGFMPDEEPINSNTEAALFCNLPLKYLLKKISIENIDVRISNSCGLYVCNRTYYEALLLCKQNPGMKAMFVHIPQIPTEETSMSLDDMTKVIITLINELYDKERTV